jgi:hypothetical protein
VVRVSASDRTELSFRCKIDFQVGKLQSIARFNRQLLLINNDIALSILGIRNSPEIFDITFVIGNKVKGHCLTVKNAFSAGFIGPAKTHQSIHIVLLFSYFNILNYLTVS